MSNNPKFKTISALVKALRSELDVSQAGLAAVLGVSQTAISRWEAGKSIPDTRAFALMPGKYSRRFIMAVTDEERAAP